MIDYIKGDIFLSPAKVIVNAVNTFGVMGKGIALAYKERYPDMFTAYRNACEKKTFQIGKLMLYYAPDYWVLLFPTKENWRHPSKIEYLQAGLEKFVNKYAEKNITSIAFPMLGCGNGELDWEDVRPVMEYYLKKLPISVYIYLGINTNDVPEHKKLKEMTQWLKSNARDLSYNGIVEEIGYQSTINPIVYEFNEDIWNAKWNDGLTLSSGDECITHTEEAVYNIWENLRINGIVGVDQEPKEVRPLFALLNNLGYLSPIIQCNSDGTVIGNGYQVNEGLDRAFSLKEAI